MRGMEDELPRPVPGPSLAEQRRTVGVSQKALADRMGVHRVTLNGWEKAAAIDPLRAARYNRALRELVTEHTEGVPA
jgi:DNA-binding transcriptional regulator YiaG